MDEHQHAPHSDSTIRTSPNATTIIELKEGAQGQSSSSSDDTKSRQSLEILQQKYELMKRELCESRGKIEELKETLQVK